MCYSKEVSLISGSGMALASSFFWWKFVYQMGIERAKKVVIKAKELRGFFVSLILAYACIAGHQFGEFFAILLADITTYKIGLIFSISATYFLVRAVEQLTKLNFYSGVVAALIGLVGVHILITPMVYENYHWWVRGYSHGVWAAVWLTLFMYFWMVMFYVISITKSKVNRKLLWFMFAGVNVSFLVSVTYAFVLSYLIKHNISEFCSLDVISGFTFARDFPSIWCTASVVQAPFYFLMLRAWANQYEPSKPFAIKKVPGEDYLKLVGATGLIMIALYSLAPFLFVVSWKIIAQ